VVVETKPHKWTCSKTPAVGGSFEGHYTIEDHRGRVVASNESQKFAVIAGLDVARKHQIAVQVVEGTEVHPEDRECYRNVHKSANGFNPREYPQTHEAYEILMAQMSDHAK
jgi:hypothetical protein